jgi:hypothetical protein
MSVSSILETVFGIITTGVAHFPGKKTNEQVTGRRTHKDCADGNCIAITTQYAYQASITSTINKSNS